MALMETNQLYSRKEKSTALLSVVMLLIIAAVASKLCLLIGNGELYIYARVDGHGGDVLHDAERGVQIDDSLMNLHFETIPCLGT